MIAGTEGMTDAQIHEEVQKGARFVYYLYCISILIMTFRRSSGVYFIPAGRSAVLKGIPWTVLTLLCGWWGVPWGPIYSIQCLAKNLSGGEDVTHRILQPARPA